MKYADIEGLAKKDPFKKGFADLFAATSSNLIKNRIRILPQSIGEPAALLDFLDYDFYLAFKTDGVGTKSLIADIMAGNLRKRKVRNVSIAGLYAGLGIDLIASNVNDLICLGAIPIALSDEIAAGDYHKFIDKDFIKGLYKGLKSGCLSSGITIPCGESPTMTDVVGKNVESITASAIGILRPKKKAIFGQKLKAGDAIFALLSSGIHTNGLSLARRIVEKLPQGYFTSFGQSTIGKELLIPTMIYVKPVLEMIAENIDIHYMSNISGSAFHKIARAKKEFTYIVDRLPKKPKVLEYLQKLGKIPDSEAYETWNMGVGYAIFAPESEEKKLEKVCQKYRVGFMRIGEVKKGKKQVIIKPIDVVYA